MTKRKGRPARKFNEQKQTVVNENVLLENPEGFPNELPEPIVISNHIPEMRTGIFINNRDPGYPLEFHYHSKSHYLKHYKLIHGKEYTLPLEVVQHLESCAEPQYDYRKGYDGHPEMYVKSYK